MNQHVKITSPDLIDQKIQSYAPDEIARMKADFKGRGFIRLPDFLPISLLEAIKDECDSIVQTSGKDKKLLMETTDNTPRQMRTVGQHVLVKKSYYIPKIYASENLREFLASIAGEDVLSPPWPPEEFVLSNLCRNGDTHGWHWDDYSYAFVLYLKAPEISQGGFVQTCGGGSWDKKNPRVNETILNAPIYTHRCEAGDAYFLHAQKYLHRVTPITRNGERLIVNMTWANQADLNAQMTHETNDVLFAS